MIRIGGALRSGKFAIPILLAMLAAIVATLTRAAIAAETAADPRIEARQIAERLPKLRKLSFKHEVQLDVETAAQARILMRQRIRKNTTPAELADAREEGVMLAMWPRDFDFEQASIDLVSSQMLGFYMPESRRMVLLEGDDAALSQIVGADGKPLPFPHIKEMTLAHELTHALQDQNFDLGRLEAIKHDDDRQLAFHAIVEGDATLTSILYTFKGLEGPQARAALGEIVDMMRAQREMVSVPDTITMQSQFLYGAGTRFVGYAFKRGGFAAVDALLRNPPSSTREILDPEKFYGHPSLPAKVEIHGYEKAMAGWRVADDNTLGEVMMIATVHQTLGDAENWLPMGAAWRGDKVLMLANGNARAIVAFVMFADHANAAHFAETYSHVLDLAHRNRVPHLAEARGTTVIVLIGESAARAPTLAPALWAQSRFGSAPPPSH
jgi:hypothetical protein